MLERSGVRPAVFWAALCAFLYSATALAGIEEHSPNPMPEWLQQELAVYTTDGVEEARALDEDQEEVEHDEPENIWHLGAADLQQHSLDEHTLIKWRLALHGIQYVTIEEILAEERAEEEEEEPWSPSDPIEDEGSLSDETTESSDASSDSLESEASALTRSDPGLDPDAGDEPMPVHGCSAQTGASQLGFGGALLLVWLVAARLRWS